MSSIIEVVLLSIWDVRIGVSMAIVNGYHLLWALFVSTSSSIVVILPAAEVFRRLFDWTRYYIPQFRNFFLRLIRRHNKTIDKYGYLGIFFIVAVPLPGTGPWTGALCTALLQMEPARASLSLAAGIAVAAMFSAGIVEGFLSLLPLIP